MLVAQALACAMMAALCLACGEPLVLAEVGELTFREGAHVATKYSDASPELMCEGPNCDSVHVSEVLCVNTGLRHGGTGGVEWECSTEMDSRYALDTAEVRCEGWESEEDVETVVAGSCYLVYSLYRSEQGFEDSEYYHLLLLEHFTILEVCLIFVVILISCV